MPNKSDTGAATTKFKEFDDNGVKGVALQIPVDIRIGLALLAKHVYCVDNGDECYDVPGFEMLTKDELSKILSSDKSGTQNIEVNKLVGRYEIAQKKAQEGTSIFSLDSDDPDVIVWIQELRFLNSNGEKYCGIMGPSGFKAAIYKPRNDSKYSTFDTSKLKCCVDDLQNPPQYIVSFAGSDNIGNIISFDRDKNTFDDWMNTNLNQGLGMWLTYSKQYKIAYTLGKFLRSRGLNMMSVGHSLGGGISSAFSVGASCKAVNFNAAGLNRGALAQYMTYPHKSFFGRVFNLKPVFVGRNNENYQRIKKQESNVQVYSSTTDLLTTTQNHIGYFVSKDVISFIVSLLTMVATAVTTALRILPIIGNSVMTDPFPPTTYGNLIFVKTEKSLWAKRWLNPLATKTKYQIAIGSELIFNSEKIGHDMSMIIDGLLNVIHEVNNLAMPFQASKWYYRGLLNKICCDGNKYNVEGKPAKAGCSKCGSICFWYRLATWENKCVYLSLSENIAENVSGQPRTAQGKQYKLSPSHFFNKVKPHNTEQKDEVSIELNDEELNSALNGIVRNRTNSQSSKKMEVEGKNDAIEEEPLNNETLKKRLKKYGKNYK